MAKKILLFISPKFYNFIKEFINFKRLRTEYIYDIRRYFKYSDYFFNNSEKRCLMRIIHRYHPIEKGLTMPEMRLGFGNDNIRMLIKDCNEYKNKYLKNISKKSSSYEQYNHALSTLLEYVQVHEKVNFKLNSSILLEIKNLVEGIDSNFICNQISISKEEYFNHSDSSFKNFLKSRYSVRNFHGKISIKKLLEAIEIAINSPSACNRQPSRVHIIKSKYLKREVLKLQGGNRGFGHLADKVLIVTAELSGYRDVSERNGVFVDGGLFSMNLLNALHYQKIAACPLNWYNSNTNDLKLRQLLSLPKSETVIMMIACGGLPNEVKLAYSKKNNINTIHTIR